MKVILKPAGVIIIGGALIGLGFVASSRLTGTKASATPLLKAAHAEKFAPTPADGWALSPDGLTLSKNDTASTNLPLQNIKLNPDEGEFRIKVKCSEVTPGKDFPKYGIGVRGEQTGDELSVWIDPQSRVLTTIGQVLDNKYDWHTTPLPAGFDMKQEHTLSIQWSGGGKEWSFRLDNDDTSLQTKHLNKHMAATMPVLMNYEARPSFHQPETR